MPPYPSRVPSLLPVLGSSPRPSGWKYYPLILDHRVLGLRLVALLPFRHSLGWQVCLFDVQARLGLVRIGHVFGVGMTSGT